MGSLLIVDEEQDAAATVLQCNRGRQISYGSRGVQLLRGVNRKGKGGNKPTNIPLEDNTGEDLFNEGEVVTCHCLADKEAEKEIEDMHDNNPQLIDETIYSKERHPEHGDQL